MKIGDAASEKAHDLQSVRSFDGAVSAASDPEPHWRDARNGGWFSYKLKVAANAPLVLRCLYWGREYGERTFDVLVDEVKIDTTSLRDTGKEEFRSVELPLDAEVLAGKTSITVKFQAAPKNTAGRLYDLRVIFLKQ